MWLFGTISMNRWLKIFAVIFFFSFSFFFLSVSLSFFFFSLRQGSCWPSSHRVVQTGLELTAILLAQFPKYWDIGLYHHVQLFYVLNLRNNRHPFKDNYCLFTNFEYKLHKTVTQNDFSKYFSEQNNFKV